MRYSAFFVLLLLFHPGIVASRRGGGSGGNNDDNDNSGVSDWYDPDGDLDGGDGGDSSYKKPCGWGVCGCHLIHEREKLFSLPGLYYNGSITIRHHLTDSTVWDDETDTEDGPCQNDDRSTKTYTYPGMFLVAPIGNVTDTNPFHWSLKGFQPPDQLEGTGGPYIDLLQRWIHIRSSDFVVTGNDSLPWTVWPNYLSSDATGMHQTTRVYWPTNITSIGKDTFSARAKYTQTPPATSDTPGFAFEAGRHTSQYATLSDVCIHNHIWSKFDKYEPIPKSHISHGRNTGTSTPTVWLTEGAAAEMLGIGAEVVTVTLNSSFESVVPLIGRREPRCDDKASVDYFELDSFDTIHSRDDGDVARSWNLTFDLSITFRGSLIEENSTRILGFNKGNPIFEAKYEPPEPYRSQAQDDENCSRRFYINTKAYTFLVLLAIAELLY
jgi:hypothetical protein